MNSIVLFSAFYVVDLLGEYSARQLNLRDSAGFTIDNNPNDSLMIVLDLGPRSEWDTATEAKMRILLAKGLSPQLFLTQEELRSDAR